MTHKTLTSQVLTVLANYERARDNDEYLTCLVWFNFHKSFIKQVEGRDAVLFHDIIENLPKSETIGRARRLIQNSLGLFPPTTLSIARGRKMAEEDWREFHSYKYTEAQGKAILDVFFDVRGKTADETKRIIKGYKNTLHTSPIS